MSNALSASAPVDPAIASFLATLDPSKLALLKSALSAGVAPSDAAAAAKTVDELPRFVAHRCRGCGTLTEVTLEKGAAPPAGIVERDAAAAAVAAGSGILPQGDASSSVSASAAGAPALAASPPSPAPAALAQVASGRPLDAGQLGALGLNAPAA